MSRPRIVSIVIAMVCASAFLHLILQPGIFNLIPYSIHNEFFSGYDSTGESTAVIEEGTFIKLFDVIISIIFFGVLYKFLFWLLAKSHHEQR